MLKIPENVQAQIEKINNKCKVIKPRVAIHSLAYNHGPYIREALDGFISQQTDFPFVAIVHDDASTDNTAEIIKEYAEKYPEIIFPLLETNNQYSRGNGILYTIMESAIAATGAEFTALCECDDFWIDDSKLQKQISFHVNNPEYGMSFHNVDYMDQGENRLIRRNSNYPKSKSVPAEDIIMGGGRFCPTCSVVYRSSLLKVYPKFAINYHVGDYPMQIYLAMISKVYYIDSVMAVYRINNPISWTTNNSISKIGKKKKLEILDKSLKFLDEFDSYSNNRFHKTFERRKKRNKYDYYMQIKKYGKALRYLPFEWYEICRFFSYILNFNKIASITKMNFYERKK